MKSFKKRLSYTMAFTLVELMVTVVIVGILGAVAVTGYQGYVIRARMSEGNVHMEAITRGEVAFFLEHKVFQFLNTMPRKVPSGKMPFLGDPSVGGYDVAVATWGKIGTPIPVNAPVSFAYGAATGKTTSDGTAITRGCIFSSGSDYNCLTPGASYIVPLENTGGGACSTSTDAYLTTSGSSRLNYAWVLIVAFGNFKIVTGGADQCTTMAKAIDTDSRGSVRSSTPIRVSNSGQ